MVFNVDLAITWCFRILISIIALWFVTYKEFSEKLIDKLWMLCLSSKIFNMVYFETFWVTVVYGVILQVPKIATCFKVLDRYKISKEKVQWDHRGFFRAISEIFWYVFPLMVLDTFMVKKYKGTDPEAIRIRKLDWIQKTRPLPIIPPTPYEIIFQVTSAFVIYDAFFYALHVTLHKNMWLYKNLHAHHHQHLKFSSKVTNQLTILERVLLILSANEALKLVSAHPLSRTFFVPLLIYSLIENHSGYDFPFTLDKLLPFSIYGGSRAHYNHHLHGNKNYEPFFTYLDRFITPYIA